MNFAEVEVFVLADYQLHGADYMVGCSISHSSIPVVPIEALEVSIRPKEEDRVVFDRLKERSEDQSRAFLLFGRKAVERVESIGSNSLRKSKSGLLVLVVDEVELHDTWERLLLVVRAILAAVLRLRHTMPHNMGVDSTAFSFASTISRTGLMDEEEAWLLICISRSPHGVRCKRGRTFCSGIRMRESRMLKYLVSIR